MWWFLLLCIQLCLCKSDSDTECVYNMNTMNDDGDRRVNKNNLRIIQYNAEWLFLDYYSPMDCPGNGCTWKNESEAQIHLNYVAQVLNELNPDIVNICEVEGCDELHALTIALNDTSYVPYLKKGTDTSTGQNVGMLTRIDPISNISRIDSKYTYPIPNSNCGYTGPSGTTGLSKHSISEFVIGNYTVALIAAHLLAYPTDPTRCAEREAQAMLLQQIVYDYIVNLHYEVILLGDFNDYDAEVLDINNHTPTSRVLDIVKGLDTVKGLDNVKGLDTVYSLYNGASLLNQEDRYSDWWDSDNNCETNSQHDYSLIDHILVSEQLQTHIVNMSIYHNYSEYCGKYNSDHYPLVIDFVF